MFQYGCRGDIADTLKLSLRADRKPGLKYEYSRRQCVCSQLLIIFSMKMVHPLILQEIISLCWNQTTTKTKLLIRNLNFKYHVSVTQMIGNGIFLETFTVLRHKKLQVSETFQCKEKNLLSNYIFASRQLHIEINVRDPCKYIHLRGIPFTRTNRLSEFLKIRKIRNKLKENLI